MPLFNSVYQVYLPQGRTTQFYSALEGTRGTPSKDALTENRVMP